MTVINTLSIFLVRILAPPLSFQSVSKMSSRIPPLLEPYLALPPETSLILLTSVLGASSNWLVLRFLHTALVSPDASSESLGEDEATVVLVSFMRDFTFWKENAKRLVGVFSSLRVYFYAPVLYFPLRENARLRYLGM